MAQKDGIGGKQKGNLSGSHDTLYKHIREVKLD